MDIFRTPLAVFDGSHFVTGVAGIEKVVFAVSQFNWQSPRSAKAVGMEAAGILTRTGKAGEMRAVREIVPTEYEVIYAMKLAIYE